MFKFIERNKFLLSVFILFIALVFKKAPFYLFFPLPGSEFDTLEYFQIVEHLRNNVFVSFGILPPGFIILCYIVGLFSAKLITIIIVEDIIYFSSLVLLLYTVNRYLNKVFYPVFLMILIVALNFYNLQYDTLLYPDFLYQISLIFTASFFIKAIITKSNFAIGLFSAFIVLPALIRSNGIYAYFLLFLLIFFLIAHKNYKKIFIYVIIPFAIIQFSWALFNKITLNEFMPGYPTRKVFSQPCIKKNENTEVKEIPSNDKVQIQIKTFKRSFYNLFDKKENFYFYLLPGRFSAVYSYNTNNPNFNPRYSQYDIYNGSLVKIINGELNSNELRKKLNKNIILLENENRKNYDNKLVSKWFTLIYFFHKLYSVLIFNIFWLLWFMAVYAISFFNLIKSRFKDINSLIVFSIGSIHFFSIIVLTIIGAADSFSLSRYVHVSEFAAFLTIGLSFLIIDYKIKLKKFQNATK